MKLLRDSSEEEMILTFLQEELQSERFRKDIRAALMQLGYEESIITEGNIECDEDNEKRKQVPAGYSAHQ